MDKYGVLWFWEEYINSLLEPRGLVFDKPICIKKTTYSYVGYFTINSSESYGQIIVTFARRGFHTSGVFIMNKKYANIIYLTEDDMIFDKRREFDWIYKNTRQEDTRQEDTRQEDTRQDDTRQDDTRG